MQRDDVTPAQQKKMLLSEATLTGIHMTGVQEYNNNHALYMTQDY